MGGLKCSNCRALIPSNAIKCEYCDTEISIIDSAKNISVGNITKNISVEGIARTAKVKGNKIKEKTGIFMLKAFRRLVLGFLMLWIGDACPYDVSAANT